MILRMKKTKTLIVMLSLLSVHVASASYDRCNGHKRSSKVKTLAAMAVGALSAGMLYNYLSGPSDDTIIWDARRAYNSCIDKYRDALDIFEDRFEYAHDRGNKYWLDVDEDLLYELATHKRGGDSINVYLLYINQTLKKLRFNRNRLAECMQDVRFNEGVGAYTYRTMKSLVADIDHIIPRLDYVYSYMRQHDAYFVSYECEDTMWIKYGKELDAIRVYPHNPYRLSDEFCTACLEKNRYVDSSYPYIDYVAALRKDVSLLADIIANIPYKYRDRLSAAQNLITNLEYVKQTIMSGEGYNRELYS